MIVKLIIVDPSALGSCYGKYNNLSADRLVAL